MIDSHCLPSDNPSDSPPATFALEVADPASAARRPATRQPAIWSPPTDVFEADQGLVVLVEIAGLKEGMFSFAVQDRRLIVSGVRQRAIRELRAFQQMEIRYGEFRSEVMLPWLVDRDRVTALYQEGFLRIELPRAEGQQIRMVNIENTPLDPLDPDEADHLATF